MMAAALSCQCDADKRALSGCYQVPIQDILSRRGLHDMSPDALLSKFQGADDSDLRDCLRSSTWMPHLIMEKVLWP